MIPAMLAFDVDPWSFVHRWLLTTLALFPLVNPLDVVPLFIGLTAFKGEQERRRQARRSCIFAALLMIGALVIGNAILSLVNISVFAVLVAGGLTLAVLGIQLISTGQPEREKMPEAPEQQRDYSLIPLAFPGLCDAGVMALLIASASRIGAMPTVEARFVEYGVVIGAIVANCILAWVVFRFSGRLAGALGQDGIDALTRLMGLLLLCIGVQFLAEGAAGLAREEIARGSTVPTLDAPAE